MKNNKKSERMTVDRIISLNDAIVEIRNLYPDMPRIDFNNAKLKWKQKYKAYLECEDAIRELPSVTSQPEHEIDHEYCKDCLHVEMCKWYGLTGCEFRDTYEDIAKKYDRPTGHWLSTLATALTTNGIVLNGVACSECGKVTYITNRTPICCPWCDTDMRGDDNGR